MKKLWILAPLASLVVASPASASAATPGSLDPTFGSNGITITNGDGIPEGATLLANGDIAVTVGEASASNTGTGVVEYLPNGQLNTAFGSDGFAPTSTGAAAIVQAPNGDLVVAGETLSGEAAIAVAELTASGAPNTSFGNDGTALAPVTLEGNAVPPSALLIESNGDIVVGGSISIEIGRRDVVSTGAVVRFTSAGKLDSTFGTKGAVSSSKLSSLATLGVDSKGDVFTAPEEHELSSTGAIDASVTPEPIVASAQGDSTEFVSSGDYVTASTVGVHKHDTQVAVDRFLPSGTADSTFTATQFNWVQGTAALDGVNALAFEPNGEIVVGGGHDSDGFSTFGVGLLEANGGLDAAFGTEGTTTTEIQDDESVGRVLVQSNDDIVAVGGTEDNSTGVSGIALARYIG